MASYTYVNGRYRPHIHATTHIDDRGYLFADGVYEVIKLVKGVLIDGEPHFKRLLRSQAELDFGNPIATSMLKVIIDELCRRNRCYTGYIYIQITRGTAPRHHNYKRDMLPNLAVELMKMAINEILPIFISLIPTSQISQLFDLIQELLNNYFAFLNNKEGLLNNLMSCLRERIFVEMAKFDEFPLFEP